MDWDLAKDLSFANKAAAGGVRYDSRGKGMQNSEAAETALVATEKNLSL